MLGSFERMGTEVDEGVRKTLERCGGVLRSPFGEL